MGATLKVVAGTRRLGTRSQRLRAYVFVFWVFFCVFLVHKPTNGIIKIK